MLGIGLPLLPELLLFVCDVSSSVDPSMPFLTVLFDESGVFVLPAGVSTKVAETDVTSRTTRVNRGVHGRTVCQTAGESGTGIVQAMR